MIQSKKRWLLIGVVSLIILIVFLIFSIFQRLKDESLINRNLTLQDSAAAVLYSSSLPYERNGDGKSYLVFISKEGEVNVMERGGMESNSLILAKDHLILNEKDEILTFDLHNDVTEEPIPQCRVISGYGQSSGYLDQQDIYYSLFNHKFKENEPEYISYIRWGNHEAQNCQEVNEYIETTGHDGEKIYLITSDLFNHEGISLVEIEIDEGSIKENKYLLTDQSVDDRFYFTNMISDEHHLYFIVADILDSKVQLKLMQINKTTRQIEEIYALHEYNLADGTKYFFFNRDSIYLEDGMIFYVDGFGDVYAYDLQKKNDQSLFRFKDYQRKEYLNDEQVFFHQDALYLFRYDEDKKLHVIEKYRLNGERESIIEIPGIKDIIRERGIFIYDFKMFD